MLVIGFVSAAGFVNFYYIGTTHGHLHVFCGRPTWMSFTSSSIEIPHSLRQYLDMTDILLTLALDVTEILCASTYLI